MGSPVEVEVASGEMLAILEGVVVVATADRIALQCPLSRKASVKVAVDMGVRVYALAGSTITTFESTIVAVTREPGLVVIAIAPPDEVVEERREFFRLTDSMPVEVSIAAEASRIAARTVDIGGGGVGILSPVLIEKGSTVTLHLELEDGPFAARSIVTRSVEVPDDHEALYRLGLSFERIDQQTQTRIVQFIFAKQREYRRKGVA